MNAADSELSSEDESSTASLSRFESPKAGAPSPAHHFLRQPAGAAVPHSSEGSFKAGAALPVPVCASEVASEDGTPTEVNTLE